MNSEEVLPLRRFNALIHLEAVIQMKDNQDNKYPVSLFVIGVLMNLTKNFFLFFPSIVLLIVGIWVRWCFFVGIALLLLDVIISLIEQIQIRSATINSDNPNFKEWQDAILSSDWKNNVTESSFLKLSNTVCRRAFKVRYVVYVFCGFLLLSGGLGPLIRCFIVTRCPGQVHLLYIVLCFSYYSAEPKGAKEKKNFFNEKCHLWHE